MCMSFQIIATSAPPPSYPPSHNLRILVECVSGKNIVLGLNEYDTIETVKSEIEGQEAIPVEKQTLQYPQ